MNFATKQPIKGSCDICFALNLINMSEGDKTGSNPKRFRMILKEIRF